MPRVTIGIPTWERDTYLDEAIGSCLAQDHDDFEVLIVLDGTTNPRSLAIVERHAADPRVRVVRHETNRGITASVNTIAREARGELIATMGDDDVCVPDRLRRQVAVFDRHPDTGVVYGAVEFIDPDGRPTGAYPAPELGRRRLVDALIRQLQPFADPTTMRHRRVFEAVGEIDESLPWEDFVFHVAAARHFPYRSTPGGPVLRYRRHEGNASSETDRGPERRVVEAALRRALAEYTLEDLTPDVDWPVLERPVAERQAHEVLARAFETRTFPLPDLAAELRARGATLPVPPAPPRRGRLVMTAFGWRDSGGGTLVPRLAAKELVRRGWEVTVFHAATAAADGPPYTITESEDDGVRLIGVHNRPHGIWDLGRPDRELDDPPITAAFARLLDRVRPDVVHFHNLHNLGAALIDEAGTRGIPSYYTTHNHWLVCPRAYLMRADGDVCGGPGDRGGDCAGCVGSRDVAGHQARLAGIRSRVQRGVTAVLAISDAVRETLLGQGYDPATVDVVRQAMPAVDQIWEQVGRRRVPGRLGGALRVGFFGSVMPHKGPQLLVEAAQRVSAPVEIQIHGEIGDAMMRRLTDLDGRGVVTVGGAFSPGDLPRLLAGVDVAVLPSMMWDGAVLLTPECLAARVPVVAARMGGLPEGIREDVDGLAFAGRDPAELAAHLERLAGEPGLLERLQAGIDAPRRTFAAFVDDLERCYAGERPGRVTAPAERPVVTWQGDHDSHHSLARVNRAVTAALRDRLPLQRLTRDGVPLDGPPPHPAAVEVRHQWPPDLRPAASGRAAVILPWEFGSVPREFAEGIAENIDELWVPSEHVRRMWIEGGVAPDRVHVVPNGVDLHAYTPDGPALEELPTEGVRFLYVGGLIGRKGPDVLLRAWERAFADRDDVSLVLKAFGAGAVYDPRGREIVAEMAERASGRIVLLERELTDDEMPALYRSCDVLVHPYRGEGFAMPVLEAMATGRPAIVTGGGPTDEFCPPDAGWRIRSTRRVLDERRVDRWETVGEPWMLEPDEEHLAQLLLDAAADAGERQRRGARARVAAERLSWDDVAGLYAARARALAQRPPRHAQPTAPLDLDVPAAHRLLATPAWRGRDRLGELLAAWAEAAPSGTPAALYLAADPAVDGRLEDVAARVQDVADAAGVDLDVVADIVVLPHDPVDDPALHAAVTGYVPLHGACAGHARMARDCGAAVLAPAADDLRKWLAGLSQVPATEAEYSGRTATGSRRGTH